MNLDKCRGCKVCQIEKACPVNAASVADGKIVIDESVCNHCGRCLGKCPFKAFEEYTGGYRIISAEDGARRLQEDAISRRSLRTGKRC